MSRFLVQRLFFCAVLIVIVASSALLLTRLAPGDLTTGLGSQATAREVSDARARFGLDRPIMVQWAAWAARAVRLDFGESFRYQQPVAPLVLQAAANSAILAGAALFVATFAGVGLGIFTGSRRGVMPAIVRAVSVAAVSMPPLLTSLALLFLAARTGWFPVGGMSSSDAGQQGQQWNELAAHLPLPVLALALPIAATFERLQSAAISEQIHQPFVTAAAARGVPPARLVLRHAWPVSVKSVAAIYGVAAGSLLSGSFAVEFVTAWPGLGRLMYDALQARDLYLVAGCAAVGGAVVSLGMLLGDVLLALSDPRVREME